MKAKEIAKNNGIDVEVFESWLRQSSYKYKSGVMGGLDVDETQDINEIVSKFKEYYAQKQSAAQKAREERQSAEMEANAARQRAEREKQEALASMLITSGFNFDGFTITKYSGYISGDDAVQIDRGRVGMFGGGASNVGDSLLAS